MRYERPVAGETFNSKRRQRTAEAGRVCATEGCTTRLSIYNRSEYCGDCDDPRGDAFPIRTATSANLGGGALPSSKQNGTKKARKDRS